MVQKNNKTKKTLDYLNFGVKFTENLQYFSKTLIWLNVVMAIFGFWFIVYNFYEPYQNIAVFMFKFMRFSVYFFIVAFLLHYLFYFLQEIIFKKAMKKIKIKVK